LKADRARDKIRLFAVVVHLKSNSTPAKINAFTQVEKRQSPEAFAPGDPFQLAAEFSC
jgi:hypothetical protein